MVHVTFYYTSSAQRNIINKHIESQLVTTAELYDNTNIFNPELIVAWNNAYTSSINYFYIQEFKRYYFIEDVIAEPGGAARIRGSVDVLYTYKNSLKQDPIVITRAYDSKPDATTDVSGLFANTTGPTYVKDSQYPVKPQRIIEVQEFAQDTPFNLNNASKTSYNFVLNVMGRTPLNS